MNRQPGPRVLIASVLILSMAADYAGLFLQHRAFPPGALIGAPLYGGMLFYGPTMVMALILVVYAQRIRMLTGQTASVQVAMTMLMPPWNRATGAVLLCFAMFWLLALSAYWVADPGGAGVTVHLPLRFRPKHYAWTDVVAREMSCRSTKGGWRPVFTVTFADGRRIDLAQGGLSSGFFKKLPELIMLTNGSAHSRVGSVRSCPAWLSNEFGEAGTASP